MLALSTTTNGWCDGCILVCAAQRRRLRGKARGAQSRSRKCWSLMWTARWRCTALRHTPCSRCAAQPAPAGCCCIRQLCMIMSCACALALHLANFRMMCQRVGANSCRLLHLCGCASQRGATTAPQRLQAPLRVHAARRWHSAAGGLRSQAGQLASTLPLSLVVKGCAAARRGGARGRTPRHRCSLVSAAASSAAHGWR